MKLLALASVGCYVAGGVLHLFRDSVPAYDKWGADSPYCGTTGSAPGSSAMEDPTAALTSFLFYVAVLDSPVVAIYGGTLAAASFLLHAYETKGASELDHYIAALSPAVVALLEFPAAAAAAVCLGLILQYQAGVGYWVVAAVGAGVALLGAIRKRRTIAWTTYLAVGLAAGGSAALRLQRDRNTAICTNNRPLSYIYDSGHAGWHVATAVLLYIGVGIFADRPRPRAVGLALAAAVPALARGVEEAAGRQPVEVSIAAVVLSCIGLLAAAFLPAAPVTRPEDLEMLLGGPGFVAHADFHIL